MASRARGVFVLLASALLASGCAAGSDPEASTPAGHDATAVVAVAEAPGGFNVHHPEHATPSVQAIMGTMWPSAYRVLPDFSAEPWLLSAPATVVSTSPFVVEWHIRPDAEWSDGEPVTAADFEYLYRHCSGRVTGVSCADAAGYDLITRFEAVDDKTVRTRFRAPYVAFPSLFRNIPPSHLAEERAGGWASAFDGDPGGSAGPFRFVSVTPGDSVVLERNPGYFGDRVQLDRLVFSVLDPAAQVDALRTGEVDLIFPEPTLELVQSLETVDGVDTQVGPGPRMERLVMNARHPFLAERGVRRAIALALDRDAFVTTIVGSVDPGAARLDNRVFAVNQAAYEGHGEGFEVPNLEQMAAELEGAGFAKDAEGVYVRDGTRLVLRLSTTSGDARREQLLQLIQAQLGEVGIQVTIDNDSPERLDARLAAGDFELAVVGHDADPFPVPAVGEAYAADGGANIAAFAEARVDEILEEAEAQPDLTLRHSLLNELDRVLWEFMPDVPLYQPPLLLAHDGSLDGVVFNPTLQGHLWNVEDWSPAPPTP